MKSETQIKNINISALRIVAVYYSIKLKDAKTLFSFDISTLIHLRAICIILTHINAYTRANQTKIIDAYAISFPTVTQCLQLLVANGLLRVIVQKRMTNLNKLVPMNMYLITPEGKAILKKLNELIELKFNKLNR